MEQMLIGDILSDITSPWMSYIVAESQVNSNSSDHNSKGPAKDGVKKLGEKTELHFEK